MSVTILLADDHAILRQGLRGIMEAQSGFKVVGEARDGIEAIQLVERLKPDVLVCDIMMPGVNGLEVTRQITQRLPHTKIVILSMYSKEGYVVEALKAGALAYVLKDSQASDLVHAVNEVMFGRLYLSPPLSLQEIEEYVKKARANPLDLYETLSHREREVLYMAALGESNSEIAVKLVISPRTVEIHRANMMRKLNLHSQTDLVRYALNRGVIPQEL